MTVDDVTMIIREAIYTIIICAAPMLVVSLVVGLLVSVFQTITSIQEQTLTFVPKVLSMFAVLMLTGHWIATTISSYTANLWNNFAIYIK